MRSTYLSLGLSSLLLMSLPFSTALVHATFRVSEVDTGWTGVPDEGSGVANYSIQAFDGSGRELLIRNVGSIGHDLFGFDLNSTWTGGSSRIFWATPSALDSVTEPGIKARVGNFPSAQLDGVEQDVKEIRGFFQVSGPTNIDSGIHPIAEFLPDGSFDRYVPQSNTVGNIPVTFSVDLEIITEDDQYEVTGEGTGSALLRFATLAPNNNGVIQFGADYDLTSTNAVPEPTTFIIWAVGIGMGVACSVVRRKK